MTEIARLINVHCFIMLGLQYYVALPRRALPCREDRIHFYLLAAGRDAARCNVAMQHIVNLALELYCVIFFVLFFYFVLSVCFVLFVQCCNPYTKKTISV